MEPFRICRSRLRSLHGIDPNEQNEAVKHLEYVGGRQGLRTLAGLLGEIAPRVIKSGNGPNGEPPQDKIIYSSMSHMAMRALARMTPNPPVPPGIEPNDSMIPVWRKWWAEVEKQGPR